MLLCASALVSCTKVDVQSITEAPPGSARIKYFAFAVGAPSVNFYVNNTKVTAIGAASGGESPNGTAYGSLGNAGFYMAVEPGQYTIAAKTSPTATTDPGLVISSVATNVTAGTSYSFYQSGIYNTTTKTADAFIVEDPLPDFDWTQGYVRFVNASSNSAPMILYLKNTTTSVEAAIGGAAAYKSAGTFLAIPTGTYDLSARASGSSTNLIARASISFSAGHVYTVTARGDMTVTSTTSANRPILDNYANR
jgi:hypothetical protein